MRHAREKVLIYTIFVVSLTRRAASTPPARHESCEEQLAKEVIGYSSLIDPASWIDSAFPDADSGWITREVLLSLEHNVRFALRLAADFYEWSMASWAIAEAAADVDHKIEVWRAESKPMWQPLETIVCSFVPGLLAFVYTFTNDLPGYVQSHQLHSVLCSAMPSMAEIISPENMNQSTYLCDVKTVTRLLYLKREFPDNRTATATTTADDRLFAAAFVRRASELVAGVDKRRMLAALLCPEYSRRNVFAVPRVDFHASRRNTGRLDWKRFGGMNRKLWHANDYVEKNTATKPNSKMSVPNEVNRLVTNAFETLVPLFGRLVREKFASNAWSFSRNSLSRWLIIALKNLCDWTPLVLAYLEDHCSDTADTAVPFGLYLTLCGDWNGFLDVQCPGTLDAADERVCAGNAIADRLLVNFYRITGTVPGDDDASGGDVELTNVAMWFGNSNKASKYVHRVHTILVEFFSKSVNALPLWTVSDWLTGKHLLADDRCRDRWRPTCSLRERTIALSGDGDQQSAAAEVPLREAHSWLVPWHSNIDNVFAIHAALFGYAYRTMNDFVFRHAEIVSMYLRHVDWPLDLMLSDAWKRTFGWHEECAQRFDHYLKLPGPREPNDAWPLDELLWAAVENFKQTDHVSFVDKNATTVPSENVAEPSAWSEHRLSGFGQFDYVDNLNRMLENNCANAVEYVNEFIRIAQDSKVTEWNPQFLEVDHCNEFVSNVLVKPEI